MRVPVLILVCTVLGMSLVVLAADTELVSVASDGEQINAPVAEDLPAISGDGRFVAFCTLATNIVPGTDGFIKHVYLRDRSSSTTICVSENLAGDPGNAVSYAPAISSDGRFVVFGSKADDLVADDINSRTDCFVFEIDTGLIELVSVNSAGEQGDRPSVPRDDITDVAESKGPPDISADGRFVVFPSLASNFADGDENGKTDVFIHDRETGETILVSRNIEGQTANDVSRFPSISDDGRFVVFSSPADDLVADDTNEQEDVFLFDRQTETIERINLAADGGDPDQSCYWPRISDDGAYVLFLSSASNLVDPPLDNEQMDVFIWERLTGTNQLASVSASGVESDDSVKTADLSADGRFAAFAASSTNLLDGQTLPERGNVFMKDVQTGEISIVSLRSDHEQDSSGNSWAVRMSDNGRFVTFASRSTELVPDDTNGLDDMFVRDLAPDAEDQFLVVTGDSLAITLTANNPHGGQLSFAVLSEPIGGQLTGTPPNLTYVPDAGFDGADAFAYQASNVFGDSVPKAVSLDVRTDNMPPNAKDQEVTVEAGQSVSITLEGSDPDGDPLTFFEITPGPQSGTLTGTPPSVIYTAPDSDDVTSDSFEFEVSDGMAARSGTVTISITPAPGPPPPPVPCGPIGMIVLGLNVLGLVSFKSRQRRNLRHTAG